MRALLPNHYGPSADFKSWPASQLAELEELLQKKFPPDSDPKLAPGEGRSLGGEDDLRSVRRQIPRLLDERGLEGDRTALDQLAYEHPEIRQALAQAQAEKGAEEILAGSGRGRRWRDQGRRIGLPEMVKVLQDSRYRLLRTVEDLWTVLQEQLQLISREAKQHLSVLYYPNPQHKGEKRKNLREDALQAYLYIRLNDRLPMVLGSSGWKVEPAVDRETLAAGNTRNDLKIQAPSIDGTRLTVIIEVKWSDNADVSTNLVTQLGEDYLLRNNLTHGLYLVGWSGTPTSWKDTLSPAPDPRSRRDAWQTSLDDQARRFCEAHVEQGLRIVPFVMDLTWDPAPDPADSQPAAVSTPGRRRSPRR
jgi:hypothetical protein